jgi:hypothetical protein
MMALAGELADGALPAGLPPQFTARARAALGPGKLLVVALSTIIDTDDAEAARAQARQAAAASLGRPWCAAAIAGLGYSEQQIASVADDLVGALVARGDADSIAAAVAAHPAAGADHVILMPSGAVDRDLMTGIATGAARARRPPGPLAPLWGERRGPPGRAVSRLAWQARCIRRRGLPPLRRAGGNAARPATHPVTARVLPPSRRARARPFRPDCPGGAAARAMITETPQPISCFISTKSEILSGYAAPGAGRHAPARARPPRTTQANGVAC